MQIDQLTQLIRNVFVDPLGNPGTTAIALVIFVVLVLVVVLLVIAAALPGRHDDE